MKKTSDKITPLDGHEKKSLIKVIREKCLDCCGQQHLEVRICHLKDCPLWPYRMGTNPFHWRNMTEEQKQAAKERIEKTQ